MNLEQKALRNIQYIEQILSETVYDIQCALDDDTNCVIEKVIDGHIFTRTATREEVLEDELMNVIKRIESNIEPLYLSEEIENQNNNCI